MSIQEKIAANQANPDNAKLLEQLGTARIGSTPRNEIPYGRGWYLVSEVKYNTFFSQRKNRNFTTDTFKLVAVVGKEDLTGLLPGEEGYNGPTIGQTYDWTIWRDGELAKPQDDYAKVVAVVGKFLIEEKGCHTSYTTEEMKKIVDDKPLFLSYIQSAIGFEFNGSLTEGTDKVSNLCGNIIVDITVKKTVKEPKDEEGNPKGSFKDGKFIPDPPKEYKNVYWNRQVSLGDVLIALGDDEARAERLFGGKENLQRLASIA